MRKHAQAAVTGISRNLVAANPHAIVTVGHDDLAADRSLCDANNKIQSTDVTNEGVLPIWTAIEGHGGSRQRTRRSTTQRPRKPLEPKMVQTIPLTDERPPGERIGAWWEGSPALENVRFCCCCERPACVAATGAKVEKEPRAPSERFRQVDQAS